LDIGGSSFDFLNRDVINPLESSRLLRIEFTKSSASSRVARRSGVDALNALTSSRRDAAAPDQLLAARDETEDFVNSDGDDRSVQPFVD
jgi:hypothetical protein